MKVLFAVSNENISESILKKYQKEYKEIISYKNVYYFNAILKEIQKDKSYDRIVISEDLEPFANNNYDAIDKFLFEKLDSISDEATDDEGNDTTVILICTDRRSKADGILVRLFGLGIYNAIIGQDRSIDEVCRLISKPRNKKEAKQYYKIEVDDVNYQSENESDVNEVEIQNILTHYKKLGKDEEKYVDSFNNIASQYTDAQLRVIVRFLPLNVKAVLEANSPKYQQVMTFRDGKGKNKVLNQISGEKEEVQTTKVTKAKQKTTNIENLKIEALENGKPRLTKPVIIPSAINRADVRKLNTSSEDMVKMKEPTLLEGMPNEIEELDDILEITNTIENTATSMESLESEVIASPVKKGRGRPRKTEPVKVQKEVSDSEPKRRGRPRKVSLEEPVNLFDLSRDEEVEELAMPQKSSSEEPVNLFDLSEDEEVQMQEITDDTEYNEYENLNMNTKNDIEQIARPEAVNSFLSQASNFMATDSKFVSFIGTSKNGTSFLVNNLAAIFSNMGINTAILDLTENKNAYYIYTQNDENMRRVANESMENLSSGRAEGLVVKKDLTVYTTLPGPNEGIKQANKLLETLSKNHELVLIDTDYKTPMEYFTSSHEIYLVQSMDILTIQPLTAFLRNLKAKGMLDESKLRVIINKEQKIPNLSVKTLIGGMAFYNEPSMSFMTDLFDKNSIKFYTIPFDIQAYIKYLEGLVTCDISTKGYSKNILAKLRELANAVYPMLNRQASKIDYGKFSPNINDTLNQMKKKY